MHQILLFDKGNKRKIVTLMKRIMESQVGDQSIWIIYVIVNNI